MSLEALNDLADTLPTIQHQVRDIRNVYDSGRDRVRIPCSSPRSSFIFLSGTLTRPLANVPQHSSAIPSHPNHLHVLLPRFDSDKSAAPPLVRCHVRFVRSTHIDRCTGSSASLSREAGLGREADELAGRIPK